MFDILFLGTGASVPSRTRALPAVVVRRGHDMILFDCGEGTQRQFMLSAFSFMKVSAIFITHLHGDHFYGLPGLVQTMGMMGRTDKLIVRGPGGLAEALRLSLSLCPGDIQFEIDAQDMEPGDVVEVGSLKVTSFATEHGVPSMGFVVREPDGCGNIDAAKATELGLSGPDFTRLKNGETVNGVTLNDVSSGIVRGKTVAYTGDTRRCDSLCEAVKGVDVLIHESTYTSAQADNASKYMHSTALSAAQTAADCGCRTLFLIHVSNRYKDHSEVLEEARKVFKHVYSPDDLALYHTTKNGVRSA